MVSSFSYIRTQFTSQLEFPCQLTQVQEVSRHLRDKTTTPQNIINTNSIPNPLNFTNTSPTCKPNISNSLKLFLAGCEHSEPGAVIASCWGIQQLHRSGDISDQEAIAQLYSKLPSALHPAPIVNLITDLLLAQDPSNIQYNLHTDQHPLALAFFCSNSCADAVLSALYMSLTKYNHPHTLTMLWPCLVQILIDPQVVKCRERVVITLLEIASIQISTPTASHTIKPLLQLILQSLIYEISPSENSSELKQNANNKMQIICIVLDFLIYNKLSEETQNSFLKDFSLFCLNFIIKSDSSTECFLILRKFTRLLTLYPSTLLLNQQTIVSIGLSLLQNKLFIYVDTLLEIVQLILYQCTVHSESHYSITRLLLTLVFPLLSVQINFSKMNADIAKQCSSLLSSILSLTSTNLTIHSHMRDYRNLQVATQPNGFTLCDYDLALYTNICNTLLLCDLRQVQLWLEGTLEQVINNNVNNNTKNNNNDSSSNNMNLSIGYIYMVINICSALLVELTQFPSIEDILAIILSLIKLIQELIVNYSEAQSAIPHVLSLFLLILNKCSHPDILCAITHTIPKLPNLYSCIVLVLRFLLTLYEIPSLQPTLLRSLSLLWQKHNSIYPKLYALLQCEDDNNSNIEWIVARGLTILDIAKTRPDLQKDDLIVCINKLLEPNTSDVRTFNMCIGVECIICMVEADALDPEEAIDLLFSHVTYKQFSGWNSKFAADTINLLSLAYKNVTNDCIPTPCEINLLTKCTQYLLSFLTHQVEDVHSAVYNALSCISNETFVSLSLFTPDRLRQFSIPICTDESIDPKYLYFIHFIDYLLKQNYSERNCIQSLYRLIEKWLHEEIINSPKAITNLPLKHDVNVIEGAIKYVWKYIFHPVPKLKHTPESISNLTPIPHSNAIAILYQGSELWGDRASTNKLSTIEIVRHYLIFISNSLKLTLSNSEFSIPNLLVLLSLIDAVTKFMSHVLNVFISDTDSSGSTGRAGAKRRHSPIESIFRTLNTITNAENCEGVLWLHVGLILNIQDLESSSTQNCLYEFINTLYICTLGTHPYNEADSDTIKMTDENTIKSHTPLLQYLTNLQTVAPIALSVLCGMMGAHLKIAYSKSVISKIARTWNSSRLAQKNNIMLDLCYSLMFRSVFLAYNNFVAILSSPSSSKLSTLFQDCMCHIQNIGYPNYYYSLFLSVIPECEAKLLKDKNAELLNCLKSLVVKPSDDVIFNCAVISCKLYSMCEFDTSECDQLIHLLLKLTNENKNRLACQFSLGLLLNHTSSLGHVSSHLLLNQTFKQLQAQLQTNQDNNQLTTEFSIYGIAALLGAGQLILSHGMPISNMLWTLISPSLRLIVQTLDSQKTEFKLDNLIPILGCLSSNLQLYIETLRTPFTRKLIPPNTMITPIIRLLEEAMITGAITQEVYQFKISYIIEMLCNMPNKKLLYNWTDIIVLYMKNPPSAEIQGSIFRLTFRFYSLGGPQFREQIKMILDYWLMSPRTLLNIHNLPKSLISQNILTLFYLYTDTTQIELLISSFMENTIDISDSVLNGVKCLLEDQTTISVQMAKINFANNTLKLMISLDPSLSACNLKQFLYCMSLLADTSKSDIIPNTVTEQCLLLRIKLFSHSDDVFWLHPVISHLLKLPPILLMTSCDANSQLLSILTQLLRVRNSSAKIISDICLEVLILSKNKINELDKQSPTVSNTVPALTRLTERVSIASNAMFILSIVSPDISCMSTILPNTIIYQAVQDSNQFTAFCLSYMRHILSSTYFNSQCCKKQTPVLKRLYDFLIGVLQSKECLDLMHVIASQQDCSVSANKDILLSSIYNYFVHFRLIHDVITTKPWAVFAQIVFSQSKHILF